MAARLPAVPSLSIGRSSVAIVLVIFLVGVLFLLAKLFHLQVTRHREMSELATQQYYGTRVENPVRGPIYDRNGMQIAGTSFVYSFGVTPRHLYSRSGSLSREDIYAYLAKALDLDLEALLENDRQDQDAAETAKQSYHFLAKDVPEEQGRAITDYLLEHQVSGVRADLSPKRYYRHGNLASQIIGFMGGGAMFQGQYGVEEQYDSLLRGKVGYTFSARDNYLREGDLPYAERKRQASEDGAQLVLTLDMGIQEILQRDLEDAIKAVNAQDNGMGIVMNPYTGEILAMASYPYFRSDDPSGPPSGVDALDWEVDPNYLHHEVWNNKNVNNIYEAGSTMKALTAAIALEEGVCDEDSIYDDSPIKVLGAEISCWTGAGHGLETMEEAFWNSCNPVFVQMALEIGVEKFYEYMRAFGFYDKTGIQLPNEAASQFHSKPTQLDLANLSFGESSSVTPVHLIRAMAAVVNGGKLVTPHVVKEIRDPDGQTLLVAGPEVVRQVVSAETSARVRSLMRGMVEHTQNYTNNWGYEVGGKTSTSTDETTGYHTISFIEAAPIDHPEILTLLILQKPSDKKLGGSEAQILTMELCSKILDYMKVDRRYTDEDAYRMRQSRFIDDLEGRKLHRASQDYMYTNIKIVAGDPLMQGDAYIGYQIPAPGTEVYPGANVYVYEEEPDPQETVYPDFHGMNYNECIYAANEAGVVLSFDGPMVGTAVSQTLRSTEDFDASKVKVGDAIPFGAQVALQMALESPAEEGR